MSQRIDYEHKCVCEDCGKKFFKGQEGDNDTVCLRCQESARIERMDPDERDHWYVFGDDDDPNGFIEPGFLILLGVISFLLVLTACGGSGGSSGAGGSQAPGVVSPVVTASVFDGRQYANSGQYCVLGSGAPKWTCATTNPHGGCAGITQPSLLKIHAGEVDAWGSGFQPVIYQSGQFQLTGSGYAWQMAWAWSNDSSEAWSPSLAGPGVAVTFNSSCVVLFNDVGSI